MNARRLAVAAAALAVVAALAGCATVTGTPSAADPAATTDAADVGAEETTAAPAAAAPDACALISEAEAEVVAATPLDEPVAGPDACWWTAPVTGPTAQVEVYVGDGAEKILDIDRELGHDLRPLPGVGAEAYSQGSSVFFQVDGTWVAILVVRLDDPEVIRGPLEALAGAVAGRI
ncbi:hypothetical protein BJF78_15235 [Pseudonocardia sp. CNS-139]|nr:hypothetical protein BJF78_15235 [Pseudonocardia sp. CNS-139]